MRHTRPFLRFGAALAAALVSGGVLAAAGCSHSGGDTATAPSPGTVPTGPPAGNVQAQQAQARMLQGRAADAAKRGAAAKAPGK